MSRKLAYHSCADYLYDRRGFSVRDTIVCRCDRLWTLSRMTGALRLMPWRWRNAMQMDAVWVRDKAAEKRRRRERAARRASDQRPCRSYDPTLDGE